MSSLLKSIRARCEEIGECWEWQGAAQTHSHTPVMRHGGKHHCVRRVIAQAQGHNVIGKVVTHKCGNSKCVNPAHVVVLTKTQLQKRTNQQHAGTASIARRSRVASARRAKAKLTLEQAEAIRLDPRIQRVIALEYGVSQATVSAIKRGRMWRDYSNPFVSLLK